MLEQEILAFLQGNGGSFEELTLQLYRRQRENCPPYAAFCASHSEPETWKEIPAIPTSAFRHAAIRCFPVSETIRTFHTSGTTGEGYGEHHFRTLDFYHAAALGGWRRERFPQGNILCLVPSPADKPHSSLSCMGGWLTDDFFPGTWDMLAERIDGRPVTLFGTALAFLDLFEWLGDRRMILPSGSLAVETGGYKGTRRQLTKEELYCRFVDKLGLATDSVWNEYGMTELSSQFYTHGLGRPHRGAPWVSGLVVDPESGREVAEGETGLLRIVDLANIDSCCAIQTRDLAIRRGVDFELLGRDPAALPRGCSRAADEMLSR